MPTITPSELAEMMETVTCAECGRIVEGAQQSRNGPGTVSFCGEGCAQAYEARHRPRRTICDCGQVYGSIADAADCANRQHAGSAEQEAIDALNDVLASPDCTPEDKVQAAIDLDRLRRT